VEHECSPAVTHMRLIRDDRDDAQESHK
jgi:hypothetical protein